LESSHTSSLNINISMYPFLKIILPNLKNTYNIYKTSLPTLSIIYKDIILWQYNGDDKNRDVLE
jgi:hypothetical protein